MLEIGNNTETNLTIGQTIPFNIVSFDTNMDSHFDSNTNSMVIDRSGYYVVKGNFVFAPTEIGDASVYLYVNGEVEPTVASTFTTTTANQKITFTIPSKVIRTLPSFSNSNVPIRFVVSAAGTLYNNDATLIKLH